MFSLRNKASEPATEASAGPLDRIGRRSAAEVRPDGAAAAAPIDRQARVAEAAASLTETVGSRLRGLVGAGTPAGEVTRQAGLQAQVHFRSYGILLSPLELRGYVAEVLRPVLPATSFAMPEPPAPNAVEPAKPPEGTPAAPPAPEPAEHKPTPQAAQLLQPAPLQP